MSLPTPEELIEQFLSARDSGEPLTPAAFAAAHPEHEATLLAALGAAETLDAFFPPHPSNALHPGTRIDRYRLVRELGRGGMGVVWEAREDALGRAVALKFLPPSLGRDGILRARFQREAQVTARLEHPSICSVLAVGLDDEQPWIAMQLVDGTSLAERIAQARTDHADWLDVGVGVGAGPRRGPRPIAAWFARVARVLEHAHSHGVVHRDVKASNLMIDRRGDPVLLDFGLAHNVEQDERLTMSGQRAGTPSHLAPEIVAGTQPHPDAQTDVYALGVTLFEALALQPPFTAPTLAALFHRVLEAPTPDVGRLRKGIPRDLAVVVGTAMQRDRRFRYRDAAAFAADLEAVAEGRPIAAKPAGPLGRCMRWARRQPRQAAAALALTASLLIAAVAAGAWFASRDEVRAAEVAAFEREFEGRISEGFSRLLDGDYPGADERFFTAKDAAPDRLEPWAGLALTCLQRGDPKGALSRLVAAPADLPLDRLRAAARGEELDDDGAWLEGASSVELFVEGQRLLSEAESLPPSRRRARAELALARLNEAVVRSPAARAMFHVQRAYAAEAAQDLDAARSAANALLTLWPDSFRELFVAGSILVELDATTARHLLEQAVRLEPDHFGALNNLASACLLLDDAPAAEPLLHRAIAISEDDPHAHNGLGLAYVDLGRLDEARAEYRRALELEPTMIEPWRNLGDLELGAGMFAAAERAYARALELDPQNPSCMADWGMSQLELGRTAVARDTFAKALQREPDLALAWRGLVRSHLTDGDAEAARLAMSRAREQCPDDPELAELGAELEVR